MKKYICLLPSIFTVYQTFAQDVIINGVNKNRLLTWDDFSGKPDKSSAHDANTYWNLNYSIKGISFTGDTAKITGLLVKFELNEKLSWVKSEKQAVGLLKHEQGHFDIGLICQLEMIRQLNSIVFFKSDFQIKIQSVFSSILDKYISLGIKYDEETDHSKNREFQENWNNFFTKELNR